MVPKADHTCNLISHRDADSAATGHVARQTWEYIRPRIQHVLKPTGIVLVTQEVPEGPHTPALKVVAVDTLESFAKSVAAILRTDAPAEDLCPDNIDDPVPEGHE